MSVDPINERPVRQTPGPPDPKTVIGTPEWYAEQIRLAQERAAAQRGGSGGRGGGGGGGANKKERARNLAAELSDRSKQLGLNLSDADIAKLAKQAIDEDWSEAVITDKLLVSLDWNNVTGGDLTAGVDLLRQMGASYLVKVGDAQAQDWAARMARGELTQQGVASMLQQQAKARFSWMGQLIDQGVKPSDYFAPTRSVIADTLEVGVEQIDMLDPTWMGLVEVADGRGGTRAATLNEAMLAARRRPEWSQTRGAQELAAQAGQRLASIFGRAG